MLTTRLFAAVLLLASVGSGLAEVRYVDVNSANPTPPYTTWATAAIKIQDVVDAAAAGDEIVVTNGIYATGGRAVDGVTTNRVAVDKAMSLRSINGPQFTIIDGGRANRCVYLTNGATLLGFTLTNGVAFNGGGVFCGSPTALVSCCVVSGNFAYGRGGGAFSSTLNNCIVYFNGAQNGANHDFSITLNYCCTTPQPSNGLSNITNAPLFVDVAAGNLRLQSNSPCINAGANPLAPTGPDLDGYLRISGDTVDIGAYEFQSPASMISYAWLQHFNLPTDGSADSTDPDGDGVNNYREWLAGSDPTNPFSFPPLLTLIPYGANVILTWPTNAFGFTLQSTTNLGAPAVWTTNSPGPVVIGGQNVVTNPRSGPQQFYRLKQ